MMSLADYNVKQRLETLFSNHLNNNQSFSDLKQMLIGKKPIAAIHSLICAEIKSLKEAEIRESTQTLEKAAYEAQIKEDDQEAQTDLSNAQIESIKQSELKLGFSSLSGLKETLQRELLSITPPTNVHEHGNTTTHEHSSQTNIHQHPPVHEHKDPHVHEHALEKPSPEALTKKIREIEIELQSIQRQLSEISSNQRAREIHNSSRTQRLQARVSYLSHKGSVYETLSESRQLLLKSDISLASRLLEQRAESLVRDASAKNYSILLAQFELYLQSAKRSTMEMSALREVFDQMQHHLTYEREAAATQSSFLQTKRLIASKNQELSQGRTKLQQLKLANPNLAKDNLRLKQENELLQNAYQENKKQLSILSTPALVLSGLSLVFSIPLVLTLMGIIPYFIESAILLTIFAVPPAVLLTALVGVGIAALVYGIKAYLNDSAISANLSTISSNEVSIRNNSSQALTLEKTTIPGLEYEIPLLEQQATGYSELKSKQDIAASKALRTATETEPLSVINVSVFQQPDSGIHQHPSQLVASTLPSAPLQEELTGNLSLK